MWKFCLCNAIKPARFPANINFTLWNSIRNKLGSNTATRSRYHGFVESLTAHPSHVCACNQSGILNPRPRTRPSPVGWHRTRFVGRYFVAKLNFLARAFAFKTLVMFSWIITFLYLAASAWLFYFICRHVNYVALANPTVFILRLENSGSRRNRTAAVGITARRGLGTEYLITTIQRRQKIFCKLNFIGFAFDSWK